MDVGMVFAGGGGTRAKKGSQANLAVPSKRKSVHKRSSLGRWSVNLNKNDHSQFSSIRCWQQRNRNVTYRSCSTARCKSSNRWKGFDTIATSKRSYLDSVARLDCWSHCDQVKSDPSQLLSKCFDPWRRSSPKPVGIAGIYVSVVYQ